MYLHRHIEDTLRKALTQSKVVLLTGPRQVGKSTTVRTLFPDYPYITLDDENELNLALADRTLFFKDRSYPLIIDEVQYAKELFRSIKRIADESNERGRLILTGSQTYELLSASAESLAGRVSILEMPSLSARELYGVDFAKPFVPTPEYITERAGAAIPYSNLWDRIWRGSMPELLDDTRDWEWFYRDYIRTYIERDVRQIIAVHSEMKFRAFITSLAARSGQMLVYSDVAKDVGIDVKTAQRWTSVLSASGLVKIISSYRSNAIARAVKTPKIYFMDTGLLCYLVGWSTPETAKNGAMAGSIFETFVVSEIIKSWMSAGLSTTGIYYYRDAAKREIDLVLESGATLYPIEIKKGATPDRKWTKNFRVLADSSKTIADGTVICQIDHPLPITAHTTALPVDYI